MEIRGRRRTSAVLFDAVQVVDGEHPLALSVRLRKHRIPTFDIPYVV